MFHTVFLPQDCQVPSFCQGLSHLGHCQRFLCLNMAKINALFISINWSMPEMKCCCSLAQTQMIFSNKLWRKKGVTARSLIKTSSSGAMYWCVIGTGSLSNIARLKQKVTDTFSTYWMYISKWDKHIVHLLIFKSSVHDERLCVCRNTLHQWNCYRKSGSASNTSTISPSTSNTTLSFSEMDDLLLPQ